jgi:hypothetical protein
VRGGFWVTAMHWDITVTEKGVCSNVLDERHVVSCLEARDKAIPSAGFADVELQCI